MDIIQVSTGKIPYRGLKNSQGLFSCDISDTAQIDNERITAYPIDMISPGIRIDFPLTAAEIARATEAMLLHSSVGHPSDQVLRNALNNNIYPGVTVTYHDLENAYRLFGKCKACMEGKHREPSHGESDSYHTDTTGEALYIDLKMTKSLCLQRHTQMLIAKDYQSGYLSVIGMTDKTAKSVYDAINILIASYASFNHIVKRLIFDHEAVFIAMSNRFPGIVCSFTPAGLHNRRVERGIQDLMQRKRCMEAALPYILDTKLEVLGYQYAALMSNIVPHESTPTDTPYHIVTGRQPIVPEYKYGECVLAISKSNGHSNIKRMEYCIFIRNDHPSDNIVYNPSTGNMLSRHTIERSEVYPSEWKWARRPEMVAVDPIPSAINNPVPADIINNQNATAVPTETVLVNNN